jgi:hypothetical protein
MQKISEWLNECGSHDIYHADKIGEDFTECTGEQPCWPVHSRKQTAAAIEARGLGGNLKEEDVPLCYGYEMAEALAYKIAKFQSNKMGRGSLFRDCVSALAKAGH